MHMFLAASRLLWDPDMAGRTYPPDVVDRLEAYLLGIRQEGGQGFACPGRLPAEL